jgi:hypothetical protein
MRPPTYLFPGTRNGWRADAPITSKVIWDVHLSRRHLHAAPIPLEQRHVTPPPGVPRSRLLRKPLQA